MVSRPATDEALIHWQQTPEPLSEETLLQRIIPGTNTDRQDRAQAWADWQASTGENILLRFVRAHNTTNEADEDIIQDALLTAYLGVESERYQPRPGVPFAAYVIGIARNKIREARRRERYWADLDEEKDNSGPRMNGELPRQPERDIEQREQREMVRSGLSRLPVDRRKVLEQYLAGASTDEIAARLAMSQALVRQHKCRGLRALQRDLQKTDRYRQAV
jgi:RNA polymerase sigma factor (sigma-70 family)